MAVLIFGGLGHVGSWVAHDIAERGDEVIVFDLGASRFESLGLDYLQGVRDRLVLENVDVLDTHTLFETVERYRDRIDAAVFGVAVIARADIPAEAISQHPDQHRRAAERARSLPDLRIKRFVNLSSGAVYGDQPGGQTEETPLRATDLYGATKIANEVLALQYGSTYGMDVRNARLYFVYGPGKLPSQMHALYQAMFGPLEGLSDIASPNGGDQAIDWTHVRDTADGIVRLLDAPGLGGESVNISCGVAVAHVEIVQHVTELLGRNSDVTLGPGPFVERGAPLDIGKARRLLGFEPRFADIRMGLADYRAWLR